MYIMYIIVYTVYYSTYVYYIPEWYQEGRLPYIHAYVTYSSNVPMMPKAYK